VALTQEATVLRRGSALLASLAATVALGACGAAPLAQPSWGAPSDPVAATGRAGLTATDRENLTTHTHAHLDVFVDGTPVAVPAGIGIDTTANGVTGAPTDDGTGQDYQVTTCDAACLSPLHTHEPDGIIHTESADPQQAPLTLGQFFTEWGLKLDATCAGEFCAPTPIAVYVDGEKQTGNPADVKLGTHQEIAVVIGKAPSVIPDQWQFLTPS
jgi:hypothetical protein